jgi:glucan biosynthesis protein C
METTQRQTYLDWLRILSILGVLFFHSAMPYVSEDGWHIKNAETSNLLMESNHFLHLFRMPLLFFISGTVSYYMMQRRSTLSFIGLRFRRLFIPLAVGMFFIVPPQIYMERLAHGYKGSFLDWYPSVFNFVPYPKGSFSWHHLWFIAYLFLYDLLFASVFAWLISPKSDGFKEKLSALAKGKWVYTLMLPGIIWFTLLSEQLPETNDLVLCLLAIIPAGRFPLHFTAQIDGQPGAEPALCTNHRVFKPDGMGMHAMEQSGARVR